MTTTTTTRPYPFLEEGVLQEYEMHLLCDWGAVDLESEHEHCTCPRVIRVVATIDPNLSPVDYWIVEPTATQDQILSARRWLSGASVIVGGIIWAEALAQC